MFFEMIHEPDEDMRLTKAISHIQRGHSGIPLCLEKRPTVALTFNAPKSATCHECFFKYFVGRDTKT